ncbi:hypothetical protein Kpol_1051p28 [Vanderwaltozyma polyspora DSM 70294]|uniref:Uncharacterized protein n=1 Tax=Vanderwaltozyma polyspora (strain ATCC 22028 / DSM 70294 / BCRC 21397 / CBS 2163 / NBRC 10782 / NRRL Y-8283 / UCD 57-17) TaxID=436907 RepID=A7TMZ1_VANPO|nr:uncharacterized protein Kpol_1051p28 [Vanderwaltozyma polyspora DSM 70294]EDO16379.1 hypothetical protein Kpol_1051p28 [Vanderwaltozyma polyspora DSM 70294]
MIYKEQLKKKRKRIPKINNSGILQSLPLSLNHKRMSICPSIENDYENMMLCDDESPVSAASTIANFNKYHFNDSYFVHDLSNRGDIWITENRLSVEWYIDNQCIRRFNFKQKVLRAGFVDFEKAPNCLIIILRDLAHVYNISNGNSTSVCFPFPIIDAFWYSQGIVLERETLCVLPYPMESNQKHKYITLTDPMSPFGLVTFSSRQKFNSDDKYQVTSKMLLLADDKKHNITVLYDKSRNEINFYYTRVMNSKSKDDIHHNETASKITDSNKIFRKVPGLNRRSASINLQHDMNLHLPTINEPTLSSTNTNISSAVDPSSIVPQSISKRSMSATIDRMGTSTTPTVIDFTPNSAQQLQQEYISQSISSKDIILTKVSTLPLPLDFDPENCNLQCKPLRFKDKEAIVIYDKESDFVKVWSITLVPHIVNSLSFKFNGDASHTLIKSSDIELSEQILEILPYDCDKLKECLVIITRTSDVLYLFNPFIEFSIFPIEIPSYLEGIVKDICYISSERIIINKFSKPHSTENFRHIRQTIFPYPRHQCIQLYFEALSWICTNEFFYALSFLWQHIMSVLADEHDEISDYRKEDLEFEAFFKLIKVILLDTSSEEINNLTKNPVISYIKSMDVTSLMPNVILGLHLVREELLLNVLCSNDAKKLGRLLFFATSVMNWPSTWKDYYKTDISNVDEPLPSIYYNTFPLDEPPSILKSLFSINESSYIPITPFINFSRLIEKDHEVDELITPRCLKLLRLYELTHSTDFSIEQILEILTKLNIKKPEIDTYPVGVLTPLRYLLKRIEDSISSISEDVNLEVIARADLNRCLERIKQLKSDSFPSSQDILPRYIPPKGNSYENEVAKPKNIYSLVTEIVTKSISGNANKSSVDNEEESNTLDDGYSLKHNAGLIFSQDRRFHNALSLLSYYKPHNISFYSRQSEYIKIINQKKTFAKIIFLRTCASGIGWGAIAYATEKPLSTQKCSRPKLNYVCLFPDGTKVSLNTTDVDHDTAQWGEFHGGVSCGLRISKKAKNINGSWIAFNKPRVLDAQHGGFLLGLGLNGHLKDLEEWHVYNYLSPKLTHVSIGLLLGMSASMRKTMDLKLTKVLSVHIVALLPTGSSDLNINLKVQTAGLIGIGLLYQGSQHKKMNELLISQITSMIEINEEFVADEGYRMAAGIALGLVNLASGTKLSSRNYLESGTEERIFSIDNNDSHESNKSNIDPIIINHLIALVSKTYDIESKWIPENSQIGTVLALMLIFLKTRHSHIAETIKPNLQFSSSKNIGCRPELYFYKEWAYHMIMWDTIGEDLLFVLRDISLQMPDTITTDKLPIYYIIGGRVMSMGIKYASTGDEQVRDSLLNLLDRLLPFYQYVGDAKLDFRLTIYGINILINVILVSVSMVMCGSGDLKTFQRIRYLHEVVTGKHSDLFKQTTKNSDRDADINEDLDSFNHSNEDIDEDPDESSSPIDETIIDPANEDEKLNDDENHFSKYISTSLSLGFLFLGSGQYGLKTSDIESVAYLIISVLPTYMAPYHLSEIKHFWSLCVDPRCLVLKDVHTEEPINNIQLEVYVKQDKRNPVQKKQLVSPCLLPDLTKIGGIRIENPDYYPFEVQFSEDITATDYFKNGIVVYLQKREKENYYDEDQIFENNRPSVQQVLKGKIDLEKRKIGIDSRLRGAIPSEALVEELGLKSLTMYEIDNDLAEIKVTNNESQRYNLEMVCSGSNSGGDVVDYQLELWRRSHSL